ncbi:opioid-binding protein/cell adhesion molecule homolog [Ruditapes philippinarum]|uniref:opioid-binding protein/cell adhesion molecule homolog n=1 Tax=Ruditapes philippinarum TaxID=129788 RepID=UPI00295C04C2|nr:opioid-binding protein/cell adhesion molecule homolog [Ruditapes philippinarum]
MDISLNIPVLFGFLKVSIAVYGVNPSIDSPVTNVTALEGNTVTLPCVVKYLGEFKVVWISPSSVALTLDDRSITDDARYLVERPFSQEWNLNIMNVTHQDAGQYRCQVNTVPVTSKTVNLAVLVPAKIIKDISSRDVILKEGETLFLQCNATGFPQPTVKWYKLQLGQKQDIHRSGDVLIIPNVTRQTAGTYECVAYNGKSDSKKTRVIVQFAPKVSLLSKRIGQNVGKETILDCKITANPPSDMYWLKGNTNLDTPNKGKYQMRLYGSNIDNTVKTLSLAISDLQKDDFGNYTCYARNSLGKDFDTVLVYDYAIHFTTPASIDTSQTNLQINHSKATGLSADVSKGNHYMMTSSILLLYITMVFIIF